MFFYQTKTINLKEHSNIHIQFDLYVVLQCKSHLIKTSTRIILGKFFDK